MENNQFLWTSGTLLVAVLGWIIFQVRSNSTTNGAQESRLTALETNMVWIRNAIQKIAEKLDITEIS